MSQRKDNTLRECWRVQHTYFYFLFFFQIEKREECRWMKIKEGSIDYSFALHPVLSLFPCAKMSFLVGVETKLIWLFCLELFLGCEYTPVIPSGPATCCTLRCAKLWDGSVWICALWWEGVPGEGGREGDADAGGDDLGLPLDNKMEGVRLLSWMTFGSWSVLSEGEWGIPVKDKATRSSLSMLMSARSASTTVTAMVSSLCNGTSWPNRSTGRRKIWPSLLLTAELRVEVRVKLRVAKLVRWKRGIVMPWTMTEERTRK